MNKKSIIALTSAAVLTVGMTIGSYAWFTSTATSQNNTFKTGILGVTSDYAQGEVNTINGLQRNAQIDLNNMQPGDFESFTYTINNYRTESGDKVSTLDLIFANAIIDDSATQYSLLNAAKFDLTITKSDGASTEAGDLTNVDYATLKAELAKDVTLTGKTANSITYKITATLPVETNDSYQGQQGSITLTATARQVNYK